MPNAQQAGREDDLDRIFHALSDRTRRQILARLREGEASVGELAEPFSLTTRAISKHIAVLEAAGLVHRSQDAQRRPSRIAPERLQFLDTWLDDYRACWMARFQKMDARLQRKDETNDR